MPNGIIDLSEIQFNTALVLIIYVFWLLATAMNLFRRGSGRRLPTINLLFQTPALTLFDSSPGDRQIYYGDRLTDGTVTAWQTVIPMPKRTWAGLVWAPHFWLAMYLYLTVRSLIPLIEKRKDINILKTTLFICHYQKLTQNRHNILF